ncbi:hypothetical protein BGX24_001340 [Mortierella sp. AD032]|nr:hypothetical protein BGX24_001340 [Mortierella sp. AD032]
MEGVRFGELPCLQEDGPLTSCAASPDGKTLAAGLGIGNISIYDTATWAKIQLIHGQEFKVKSLAFSPSGLQLLSGSSREAIVRLWNCETELTDCKLEGHTDEVKAVAYSPSGRQVASTSSDKTVRLWDAQTGATLFVMDHTDEVTGIAYSSYGINIVSCSKDGSIRMFDLHNGNLLQSARTTDAEFQCVAYSPDGKKVVLGDGDGGLQLWKTDVIEREIGWDGHSMGTSSVQFSPSGQWVLSSSSGFTLMLWEAQTSALISAFAGHANGVTSAIFLPTTSYVISSSYDETVRVWEVSPTGVDPAADYTTNNRQIAAYSPDGRSLISEGRSGMLQNYDADTGELGLALHSHNGFECAAYSPNGLQIASAGLEGGVELWNAQSCAVKHNGMESDWAHVMTIEGFFGLVKNIAWRPNTTEFATAGGDGSIRTWKVEEVEGRVSVQMLWGHGGTALTAPGAVLVGSVGLSTANRKLLKQRGAIFEFSSSNDESSNNDGT